MSQRRVNEDRMRNANEEIYKLDRIASTIEIPISKIEEELTTIRIIKENIAQI